MHDFERYQRNRPIISEEEQARLREKTVAVIGVGGLGGYICEHLVRSGVGHLILVDDDVFAESNLNRQRFSEENIIGRSKVLAAREALLRISSGTEIEAHAVRFRPDMKTSFFENADLAIDALDSVSARLDLEQFCAANDLPMVHGAINQWYGQVSFIWPGSRHLKKIYRISDPILSAPANLSCIAGIVAGMEAEQALCYLLGKGRLLDDVLFTLNLETFEFAEIPLGQSDLGK